MRTKTLVLSAVLGAAGLVSSFAQVYSVNAVGYINLTLSPGFQMIANQLDNGSGNQISALLGNVPDGTFLYKYNNAAGKYDVANFDFGAWDNPTATLAPGEGAFVLIPAGGNVTVTFVGEVPQGTGANSLKVTLPKGFSIASSKVPQTLDLSTAAASFPAADGDFLYRWNKAQNKYDVFNYDFGAWDSAPVMQVGEAFFLLKGAAATWSRDFSVQ